MGKTSCRQGVYQKIWLFFCFIIFEIINPFILIVQDGASKKVKTGWFLMQFFQLNIMKMKIIFDTIMLNLLLTMLDWTGLAMNLEIPLIEQFFLHEKLVVWFSWSTLHWNVGVSNNGLTLFFFVLTHLFYSQV